MELVKNQEVKRVLAILRNNMASAGEGNKAYFVKYEKQYITPEIEQEIEQAYQTLGLGFKLKRSKEELYAISYNRDISLANVKNVYLAQQLIPKYQLQAMDYSHIDNYLLQYVELGYYEEDIYLPQIKDKGDIWMTPSMTEYNTMQKSIKSANGHILTFGLGLGFYQYLCLCREEVTELTVVEKNPRIIHLFKTAILPQFKTNKPIHIIQGDIADYYTQEFVNQFNHVFVDIWFNNEDGYLIYMGLLARQLIHPHIDYWVEDSFLMTTKYAIATYLIHREQGTLNECLRRPSKDLPSCLFKGIHTAFGQVPDILSTESDILKYIHDTVFIKKCLVTTWEIVKNYTIRE